MIDKASIIVSGSIAYDHLLFHDGNFSQLPSAAAKDLNISMLAMRMRREFGGCAGNIIYNLEMLQPGAGVLVGSVGHDIDSYLQWLQSHNISKEHVLVVQEQHTAQAFITTDSGNNQITVFHPGAMEQAHLIDVSSFAGAKIAIVSPDGRQAMLDHCRQFQQAKVPLVFDPGQATGMFNGEELLQMTEQASYIIANEHEWELLLSITGVAMEKFAGMVEAAVVTKGEKGAAIYFRDGTSLQVDAVKPEVVRDPTGCGDAWRAAMLYGLARGMDWQSIANLGSLVAATVVATNGPQNHSFSQAELASWL